MGDDEYQTIQSHNIGQTKEEDDIHTSHGLGTTSLITHSYGWGWLVWVVLGLLVLFFVLVIALDHKRCSKDTDCQHDEYCDGKRCQKLGGSCSSPGDCSASQYCNGGTCTTRCSPAGLDPATCRICIDEGWKDDCPPDSHCADDGSGRCVDCNVSSDCPGTQVCKDDGTCAPSGGGGGGTCCGKTQDSMAECEGLPMDTCDPDITQCRWSTSGQCGSGGSGCHAAGATCPNDQYCAPSGNCAPSGSGGGGTCCGKTQDSMADCEGLPIDTCDPDVTQCRWSTSGQCGGGDDTSCAWKTCATEGWQEKYKCACPGGVVRYGYPPTNKWAPARNVGPSGKIQCQNADFGGDPAQFKHKICQCKSAGCGGGGGGGKVEDYGWYNFDMQTQGGHDFQMSKGVSNPQECVDWAREMKAKWMADNNEPKCTGMDMAEGLYRGDPSGECYCFPTPSNFQYPAGTTLCSTTDETKNTNSFCSTIISGSVGDAAGGGGDDDDKEKCTNWALTPAGKTEIPKTDSAGNPFGVRWCEGCDLSSGELSPRCKPGGKLPQLCVCNDR